MKEIWFALQVAGILLKVGSLVFVLCMVWVYRDSL